MRIHHTFLVLSAFIMMVLIFACTSDPKEAPQTEVVTQVENAAAVITEAIPPSAPVPSAEEIAAAEAEKVAAEKAAKKEKEILERKERKEAASKERRRKRREKRKKLAAEKAAAEKTAQKAVAEAKLTKTTNSGTVISSPVTRSSVPEEDLSDIDPDLLAMVQGKSTGGTPRIRFDSKSFDFGRIIQGKEIDHQFEFTNTGSAPLVISNVEVTCGCTTPFYPFIPIEPGERGKISVHFSSKGRLGNQSPTITVYTNTADPGTYELNLKGVIDTERADQ